MRASWCCSRNDIVLTYQMMSTHPHYNTGQVMEDGGGQEGCGITRDGDVPVNDVW
jgi:hypothetical protein